MVRLSHTIYNIWNLRIIKIKLNHNLWEGLHLRKEQGLTQKNH